MSQMTATARATPRAPRRGSDPRPLRVVPGAAGHPGSGVFAALCTALLVGGLMVLLMLNTALAQGSFRLHDLQASSGQLSDAQDALTSAIDAQRAPAALASRAARLGMVPAEAPAFLRLPDGKVLGVAKPASKGAPFTVVTSPTPPPAKPAKPAKPAAAGPQTTVTTKGDITTTTVTTPKANGEVEKRVTTVDARTKATTSTTTITKTTKSATAPPTAAKAAGKPAGTGKPKH